MDTTYGPGMEDSQETSRETSREKKTVRKATVLKWKTTTNLKTTNTNPTPCAAFLWSMMTVGIGISLIRWKMSWGKRKTEEKERKKAIRNGE